MVIPALMMKYGIKARLIKDIIKKSTEITNNSRKVFNDPLTFSV